MKSIGTVLLASLLLGGCASVGMLGFELEITADDVDFRPVTDKNHIQCSAGPTTKDWC